MLLRATRVTRRRARRATPGRYRQLFRTLKFLRLLPVVDGARPDGGYRIELDGPFSLFQGGTRYGLQLGLALPAIAACDSWSIEADVRWGADRRPLRFRARRAGAPATAADGGARRCPTSSRRSSTAFERLDSGWRVDREPAVLDLPGAGLCVPDLAFVRARDGARVYFELLGFWSREAVWRRVELVRAGLPAPDPVRGQQGPARRRGRARRDADRRPLRLRARHRRQAGARPHRAPRRRANLIWHRSARQPTP